MSKQKKEYKFGQFIGDYGAQFLCTSCFKDKKRHRKIWVQCGECKKPWLVFEFNILKGHSKHCCKSCVILLPDELKAENSPIYGVWRDMKHRCNNPNNPFYPRYGGRGIKVCERWTSFRCFEEDMLRTYLKGLQLDRVDNDAGYSPGNCRWVDRKTNARNTSRNVKETIEGETKTLAEWAEKLGIPAGTLYRRRFYGNTGSNLFRVSGEVSTQPKKFK